MSAEKKKYEVTDVWAKPIAYFAIALAIVTALSMWGMDILFNALEEQAKERDTPSFFEVVREPVIPTPTLEVHPSKGYDEHRRAEESLITSYAWVNPDNKIVRIPVNRALVWIANNGIPEAETKKEVHDA